MRVVDLGWVYNCAYNFFVSGLKFTKFVLFNEAGIALNEVYFVFSIYGQILEIFAVKVENCPISRNFGRFLSSQILKGRCPQMLYISDTALFIARHVAKFHEVTLSNPKVIGANSTMSQF